MDPKELYLAHGIDKNKTKSNSLDCVAQFGAWLCFVWAQLLSRHRSLPASSAAALNYWCLCWQTFFQCYLPINIETINNRDVGACGSRAVVIIQWDPFFPGCIQPSETSLCLQTPLDQLLRNLSPTLSSAWRGWRGRLVIVCEWEQSRQSHTQNALLKK